MLVGAISVIIATIIGVITGGLAGYFGGKADILIMRIAEIVGGLPFIPFAMILSAVIGIAPCANAKNVSDHGRSGRIELDRHLPPRSRADSGAARAWNTSPQRRRWAFARSRSYSSTSCRTSCSLLLVSMTLEFRHLYADGIHAVVSWASVFRCPRRHGATSLRARTTPSSFSSTGGAGCSQRRSSVCARSASTSWATRLRDAVDPEVQRTLIRRCTRCHCLKSRI